MQRLQLRRNTLAGQVPPGAHVPGELSINLTDGVLYFGNVSGVPTLLTLPQPAAPLVKVGLVAVPGTAVTFMRSDAAPALDVAIAPAWSGQHAFTLAPTVGGVSVRDAAILTSGTIAVPRLPQFAASAAGIVPASGGGTANFLRADGAWTGVPFASISAKPTTVSGYGITDAITTANIGAQSVAFATNAGRAHPVRADGVAFDLNWAGQGGQPSWLVGSNNGIDFYVYNPANFSVNSALTASQAATQPAGSNNNLIATTAFVQSAVVAAASPGYAVSGNGYYRLSGGVILQWGQFTVGQNAGLRVNFPVAYGSFSRVAISGDQSNDQNAQDNSPWVTLSDATGFNVYNARDGSCLCSFIAIGA